MDASKTIAYYIPVPFTSLALIRLIKCLFISLFIFSINTTFGQEYDASKKITIQADNQSIDDVLSEITKQSGLNFSFNSKVFDANEKISFHVSDKTLKEILETLSKQLNLDYKIIEDQIILKKPKKKKSNTKNYTLSGTIIDKESGESLPGATIQIAGTNTGTISNAFGFYSITLPEGIYNIEISYIGYLKESRIIELKKNQKLNQILNFNTLVLGEITIQSNEQLENLEKSQMSKIIVNPKTLATLPEFAGEVGLIKSLQTLPGIKTHSDGSAFFFVRGGNKDQNLILIDDAPIYNPAHLFGYYSVIIPDVAKEISIYKADMPIEKGDRLSSVIDVRTKDGNMNKFELNGVLNPLMYRFSIEGPIKKEKASFYTSFRHSNFKWIYAQVAPNSNLYMLDFNAKLNVQINKNNRIYYSIFYGKDNFTTEENTDRGGIKWSNFATTLRWNHIFGRRLFSNATIYGSQYNYALITGLTEWVSEIGNLNINYDLTYYLQPQTTFKFGINQSYHWFNPGNLTQVEDYSFFPVVQKSQARKTVFYANGEHDLSDKWSVKLGFRLPIWSNTGPTIVYQFDSSYQVTDTIVIQDKERYKSFVNFDPRISLKFKIDSTSSLKFSYGIYHQYVHMLSNTISPFSSFEVWLPSGTNIKPQRADQIALGYVKYFKKAHLELNAEVYYKYLRNQIDYAPHANLLLNPLIEGELRFGEGKSYGFELLLRRTKGRLSGWISYTYSRTLQTIEGLNNNQEFPAFYDRPHDFAIYLSYNLSKRVNISANWIYYTGSAITTPVSFYNYNGYTVPLYGDKNNDRLPDYHRLDLALSWRLNKSIDRKYQHNLTFAIYNFYNQHNPVSVNFNKIETRDGKFVVPSNLFGTSELLNTQKYLLGIMPSITYKFRI
ncbi:MAG: hypothetical protein DRH21_04250 [Deltaproteobacteria bacterium]|nr:MAG: hypothetical protein DRH21_04250 [Deltaproteobacteria bacterium]